MIMHATTTETPLIVETSRGPCIAGRRLTVYVIYEHLQSGLEREFIKEHLLLSDAQLDAAVKYIAQHKDKIATDYAEIVRRSEERQAHYEQLYRQRSRFPTELPPEERAVMLRQLLNEKTASVSSNDEQDPA
jgi:uncharacterized protein (DUF433 family)